MVASRFVVVMMVTMLLAFRCMLFAVRCSHHRVVVLKNSCSILPYAQRVHTACIDDLRMSNHERSAFVHTVSTVYGVIYDPASRAADDDHCYLLQLLTLLV